MSVSYTCRIHKARVSLDRERESQTRFDSIQHTAVDQCTCACPKQVLVFNMEAFDSSTLTLVVTGGNDGHGGGGRLHHAL